MHCFLSEVWNQPSNHYVVVSVSADPEDAVRYASITFTKSTTKTLVTLLLSPTWTGQIYVHFAFT